MLYLFILLIFALSSSLTHTPTPTDPLPASVSLTPLFTLTPWLAKKKKKNIPQAKRCLPDSYCLRHCTICCGCSPLYFFFLCVLLPVEVFRFLFFFGRYSCREQPHAGAPCWEWTCVSLGGRCWSCCGSPCATKVSTELWVSHQVIQVIRLALTEVI